MVGMNEISIGLASLKTGKDILASMIGVRDATKLSEDRIRLQQVILDAAEGLFAAQQEQATTADRIADLEQEIVRLKDWETEKQRYELTKVGSAAFVYAPKRSMLNGQPPHWLCASCFDDGKKSILQPGPSASSFGSSRWMCGRCKQIVGGPNAFAPELPQGLV